jgi:hypothetical protein
VANLGKKLGGNPISTKKMELLEKAYNPSYIGDASRRIIAQACPGKKM